MILSFSSLRPSSPFLALVLSLVLSLNDEWLNALFFPESDKSPQEIFIGVFIMAHLFIVFFRSHGNPQIRGLYPWRFFLAPPLLLLAMLSSLWALAFVSVLATWWDVYHSGMQTFGLGRMYDARANSRTDTGRRLDQVFNQLIYAGPILGGATFMAHVEDLDAFERVGSVFLTGQVPAYARGIQADLTKILLVFAVFFTAYYFWRYYNYWREGYNISLQKVALYSITSVISVLSWGFNSFGEAFFIMNFFHALQYFALVWWAEGGRIQTSLGLSGPRAIKTLGQGLARVSGLCAFVAIAFAYGAWTESDYSDTDFFLSVTLVVSIMHFWYDGFIWSVRKKQV